MYLKRYHDLEVSPSGDLADPPPTRHEPIAGLAAVSSRHKDRWKRYEKPLPGSRVQLDVKFIAPLPGSRRKFYQYTAIDDCTRLRVLRVYPRCNQATSIRFLDEVLAEAAVRGRDDPDGQRCGVPVGIPLPRPRPGYRSRLHPSRDAAAQRQGRAVTPDRCRRVLPSSSKESSSTTRGCSAERLRAWEDYYNFDRPHGGLGGQTPYERLRLKTGAAV